MGALSLSRSEKKTRQNGCDQNKTWSKTVESGAFIRTTYRKGNKRQTKTEKFQKNQKKVILGMIGDFEVYIYPFDYPDTVFIGKFPVSTKLDSFHVKDLLIAFNRARWFLEGNWQNEAQTTKASKIARQQIQRAYNLALKDQRRPE